MADEKSGAGSSGGGKRPYATLDLKATEINVAPAKGSASASSAASSEVPGPAAARTYADASGEAGKAKSEARAQSGFAKSENASASASSPKAAKSEEATVIVQKRGGFFSHLAAGIVGGALAFGAVLWALPELEMRGTSDEQIGTLAQRLAAVEKKESAEPAPPDLSGIQSRIADLENAAQKIPGVIESQQRLVAETKAALASAASDAGTPQLIERLGKVEDRLKQMADAGVNDPNANRLEQIAGLTGKVSDLETSLSTQLTALRANVTKD
ncbi:MAG: hypothetical protein ABUL43_00525, partial [Hyphomicrobium sp.]